ANTPAGGTVDFQPGLTGTITLTSDTLTIDHSLTLTGPGAKTLTVSGNYKQLSVFRVSSGVTATLAGVSIVKSWGTPVNGEVKGGGILNEGTLTVTGCVLSNNEAFSVALLFGQKIPTYGGGIYNNGTLTVIASTLSGNSSVAFGHFSNPFGYGGWGFNKTQADGQLSAIIPLPGPPAALEG